MQEKSRRFHPKNILTEQSSSTEIQVNFCERHFELVFFSFLYSTAVFQARLEGLGGIWDGGRWCWDWKDGWIYSLSNPSTLREKELSLPSLPGAGTPLAQVSSRTRCGRLHFHTPSPLQDLPGWKSFRSNSEQHWFILHFQVILWTFWSKTRWLFYFIFFFSVCCFFFSQGFPKWMAVKDFNILQAQQLILKSLAEGSYRGKLGCKSFWRLFPFWNL